MRAPIVLLLDGNGTIRCTLCVRPRGGENLLEGLDGLSLDAAPGFVVGYPLCADDGVFGVGFGVWGKGRRRHVGFGIW